MQINYTPYVLGINPPEVVPGTNAGVNGNISIVGDDSYGLITVNTGDNPYGQKICSVIFQQNQGTDNLIVEVMPYNRQAMIIGAAAEGTEGSGFELNTTQELNDNNVYQWTYRVTKIITA